MRRAENSPGSQQQFDLPPLPERPLISVIMPSYNQGRFIRQAIDSCLQQDYRPIEIIVVDGKSKDETIEVLKSYGEVPELRWISEPDNGPVEAVNKGFSLALGDVGLIQSADDLSAPGAFSAAIAAFGQSPRLGLVYGDYQLIDENGHPLGLKQVGRFSRTRLFSRASFVPQPCAFFRLNLARELGGWDERFPYCPDTELWFKLVLHAEAVALPQELGCSRKHAEQRDTETDRIVASYHAMVRHSAYLQSLSCLERRALYAGVALLELRYLQHRSKRSKLRYTWRAIYLWPPLIATPSIPVHQLLPGYFALTGFVGKFRRFIRNSASASKLWLGLMWDAWRNGSADMALYRQMQSGPPVFITGTPRSGTTWIAEMLAIPGIWYIHEPFNPNKRLWKEHFTYLDDDARGDEVDQLLARIQKGGARKALRVPHASRRWMPLRVLPVDVRRLMIKDPIACLMAGYVHRVLQSQTIVIFRHPAGFVRSYHDLRWPVSEHLQQFLASAALMSGPLAAFRALIAKHAEADGLESVAVLYGCLMSVLWQTCERNPDMIRVRFETLAEDPINQFRDLFARLNLPYSDEVRALHERLTQRDNGNQGYSTHEVQRNSTRMAWKWRGTFSQEELESIRNIWCEFGLPLYESDEEWQNDQGAVA